MVLIGLTLGQFLSEHQPKYVAVSFDYVGPRQENVRRRLYQKYKANRPEQPPELRALVPKAISLIKALGCRTLQADGKTQQNVYTDQF